MGRGTLWGRSGLIVNISNLLKSPLTRISETGLRLTRQWALRLYTFPHPFYPSLTRFPLNNLCKPPNKPSLYHLPLPSEGKVQRVLKSRRFSQIGGILFLNTLRSQTRLSSNVYLQTYKKPNTHDYILTA